MENRGNAFEAGRGSGSHRIRSRSIHRARAAGASSESESLRSRARSIGVRMRTESRGGALLLDSEDLLKFFPGVMTSDCSIGPRILAVVDAIFKVAERGRHRKVWREFRADALLRQEHHVTEEELRVLETLAPLGMVTGSGDILFVLSYIRSALQARQKAIANA